MQRLLGVHIPSPFPCPPCVARCDIAVCALTNIFFESAVIDRNIAAWDRNRNTYCPLFSLLSNTLVDLVVVKFIPPILAAALVYYPCNLNPSWSAFWEFMAAYWLLCFAASCFSRFTFGHTAFSHKYTHTLTGVQFLTILTLLLLYCGSIIYLPDVPDANWWFRDWSMFYWVSEWNGIPTGIGILVCCCCSWCCYWYCDCCLLHLYIILCCVVFVCLFVCLFVSVSLRGAM